MLTILKKYPALWITVLLFLLLETAVRLLPSEYAASTGVFLTNYRKQLAEASTPDFDYIILGDSRSMSLMGHPPTTDEPYSIYNFSMPAMGPRYYKYFVQKYLRNRKLKPTAIIFAGDPRLFQTEAYNPYHDPRGLYSLGHQDPLWRYLYLRLTRRIGYALAGGVTPGASGRSSLDETVWNMFSHRYLHLFDLGELYDQFTGAERVFIIREAIPLLARTYKFRESVMQYTVGLRPFLFREIRLPETCNSCSGALRPECHPEIPRVEDHRLLVRGLHQRYGQLNIGDRLTPQQRLLALMYREQSAIRMRQTFEKEKPDLSELEALIREINGRGIKMILTEAPHMEAARGTQFFRLYEQQIARLLKKYPQTRRFPFPRKYYPVRDFIEQIHYDCPGAEKLNRDFYGEVVPRILKFAPPDRSPLRAALRKY